jgi:predicted nucleotidyltransferase
MVDKPVVDSVRSYLRGLQERGITAPFGVIFGSQATGGADEWSDIDVLVVSPTFDQLTGRQLVNVLWRLAARMDSRIEPVPCGLKQWQEDDVSPILEMARREGFQVVVS